MANEDTQDIQDPERESGPSIEGGNYEIIRARLLDLGRELGTKATDLNERRKKTFGGTELAVIGNERVRTENKCIPRDIVPVAGLFLFGYKVNLGLRSEIRVEDVFSLHHFETLEDGFDFSQAPMDAAGGFLTDPDFQRDFTELFRYYKDAKLLQLRRLEAKILAIFQVGSSTDDVKVMRWTVGNDGVPRYQDAHGDGDHVFPRSHDFKWKALTREHYIFGKYPHATVEDEVFVETVGGDLTIKIEDNTEDGQGIYSEPVDDAYQSLDDAQIEYARVGTLIILRILPYREQQWRHFVFNTRNKTVLRIDAIAQACVQLPEDHGIIFPGGYYLQSGEHKVFEGDTARLEFKTLVRSPNGEDVLYIFHRRAEGLYVLFPYNLIRKEIQNPIPCHGYSVFDDGKMVIFRGEPDAEPTKVHPMQIWQTPFMTVEHAAAAPTDGSFLSKVGNADLVRGISEAYSIRRMIVNQEPSRYVYEDLIAANTRVMDQFYWLGHDDVGDMLSSLQGIRRNAELIIDEFEKVLALQARAESALLEAEEKQREIIKGLRPQDWKAVDQYIKALTRMRNQRGHLITMREVRYMKLERLDELEAEIVEHFDQISEATIDFLLGEDALKPLTDQLESLLEKIEAAVKTTELEPLLEKLNEQNNGLNLLNEVVNNLQVDDPTKRVEILNGISEIFGQLNRVRATAQSRRKELLSTEGRAEFAAQFKLLSQSVSNALTLAETPEACDEQLSRLMLMLEELEGRFSEFDDFLVELTDKRQEIYEAFESRKQSLLEQRQRRIENLASAASRIVSGINRRVRSFKTEDELNAYFASDAMILKLRQVSKQIRDLGDSVKSDEIDAQLKSSKQDAIRGLRDKLDLFEDGDNVIKFGRHRFSVNTQELQLTMVPRDGTMALHLTGTNFYQPIERDDFVATKDFWDQSLISETSRVYRGEYLAASVLFAAERGEEGLSLQALTEASLAGEDGLLEIVRTFAANRYDEGYERGLHDADAAAILEHLLALRSTCGLLRFAPRPRAMACLFWAFHEDPERHALWQRRARSLGRLRSVFAHTPALGTFCEELSFHLRGFFESHRIPSDDESILLAGRYLAEELMAEKPRFTTSNEALMLRDNLMESLSQHNQQRDFLDDLRSMERNLSERIDLSHAWVEAFVASSQDEEVQQLASVVLETAVLLLTEKQLERDTSNALTSVEVTGLLGQHPRVRNRTLQLRLDEFMGRLTHFIEERAPAYRAYRKLRAQVLEQEFEQLRVEEFKPKVLSAFVRNKLINDVYLHLVGDNLAKQMGTLGDSKRTDLMGLLLLISPPGYGKTTLMEYIANRLGLVFMKVNGPALGHSVVSIDPAEAPNATARQEVEKINLAFEMGNNVMLYLDDIQHCHPELLQKFISLCDGQRRIEGVWRGKTRTYDLRGKKFCVIMAGNPYTESGDKFQIPDMLANRADTYNLGDVLEGRGEVFALSYIENSLTSNPTLAPLATRSSEDTYKIIRMAQGEEIASSELEYGYAAAELGEIISVLQKLFVAQEVLLKVNLNYIASASMDDNYRTEPSFKLQGSYRNMNKIAEKIPPAMNDKELQSLITDHYVGEAQTLTTGAETNLLKLAELRDRMTDEQKARWEDIKKNFKRLKMMGGAEDDPVTRVTGTLTGLSDQLEHIHGALIDGVRAAGERAEAEQDSGFDASTLAPLIDRLSQAMSKLSKPKLDVNIQNEAPPGVEELLSQHVMLVERMLVPLVRASTDNLSNAQALGDRVGQLLEELREVGKQLGTPKSS